MELFLRINIRNVSRELPKYFASEIFWCFWEVTLRFSERGRMHVCVWILRTQNAVTPCALFLSSTWYVHAVAFLSRRHAPESGRGDDEATGNTQPCRKYFGGSGGHRNETGMVLCRWISSCSCLQPNLIWWSVKRPNRLPDSTTGIARGFC